MSYSVIEFLDENLTEIHSSSLASILLSCGNEVALRNKYPELCDRLFDKDFESLDDISEYATEYAEECNRINAAAQKSKRASRNKYSRRPSALLPPEPSAVEMAPVHWVIPSLWEDRLEWHEVSTCNGGYISQQSSCHRFGALARRLFEPA